MRISNSKETPLETNSTNLHSFLDMLPVPAAVLKPEYNSDGEISDFTFSYINLPASRSLISNDVNLEGQSFSDSLLNTGTNYLFDKLKDTLINGVSLRANNDSGISDMSSSLNAVRFGHRIVIQWKDEKQIDEQAEKIKLLQNSNRELEDFAYIASHDLQEPVRMVISFTQLLQKRYADKLDDDAKQFIHFAVDGAERMKALIDKLLEYSRVSTAKRKWNEIDVKKIIDNIIEDFDLRIKETGIKINYGVLPVVVSDESLLTRVFANIISNSVKYRKENNPIINITASETDYEWKFAISDNGMGIKEKYFEKIFLMFRRLHGKTEYPGMGMGLAICKRVIDTLGGRIWLESDYGKGSTFYFTIPKKEYKNAY